MYVLDFDKLKLLLKLLAHCLPSIAIIILPLPVSIINVNCCGGVPIDIYIVCISLFLTKPILLLYLSY